MSQSFTTLSPWVETLAKETGYRAAAALSVISGTQAEPGGCVARAMGAAEMVGESLPPGYLAEAALSGAVTGNLLIALAMPDAQALAKILVGAGSDGGAAELDDIALTAVQEGCGQIAAALEGSLGTVLGQALGVELKPGAVHERPVAGTELVTEGEEGIVHLELPLLTGEDRLTVRVFFDYATILAMGELVLRAGGGAGSGAKARRKAGADAAAGGAEAAQEGAVAATGAGDDTADAAGELPSEAVGGASPEGGATQATGPGRRSGDLVQPARFDDLSGAALERDRGNIDLLLDIPVNLTVELGRTRRLVNEILSLGPGSVVELEKTAGESLDILVNGRLIGRGEVVIINENFGIRVTELTSPGERTVGVR
jgi:flagellar motor switch protein FliN/FliY